MRGLTLDELKEVITFAQKYHAFAKWPTDEERKIAHHKYPLIPEFGYNIKYIDTCYDSRGFDVWMIKFRQGRDGVCFQTNHFVAREKPRGWKYDNLYDLSMAYLKGEFIPKEEFYFDNGAK